MGTSFEAAVYQWHDFYLMVGAASASLVGLLFVSVSLNVDLMAGEPASSVMRLAESTLSAFINLLIISAMFLIPSQVPIGLGVPLAATALVAITRTVRIELRLLREHSRQNALLGLSYPLRRVALSLISYVWLLVVALLLLLGQTGGLYWLVGVNAMLLANGAVSAWALLVRLAAARRESKGQNRSLSGLLPAPLGGRSASRVSAVAVAAAAQRAAVVAVLAAQFYLGGTQS